jgi:hypothetical protein
MKFFLNKVLYLMRVIFFKKKYLKNITVKNKIIFKILRFLA